MRRSWPVNRVLSLRSEKCQDCFDYLSVQSEILQSPSIYRENQDDFDILEQITPVDAAIDELLTITALHRSNDGHVWAFEVGCIEDSRFHKPPKGRLRTL
jgi:hypothetical protein